jgi:NAD(P)-dependent dehydrogenase (short-subunit alcohol dehydrogenase family)
MLQPSRNHCPSLWRHVLITGGAQGLGAALGHSFALAGAHVSLVDRAAETLEHTRAAISELGCSVASACCDVADRTLFQSSLATLQATHGDVDAVFFCAAIGGGSWVDGINAATLQSVVNINLLGTVNGLEHFVPRMAARGSGTLVLVSSLLDARGYPGTAAYSASKAALRSVADSTRILCASSGVRVVLVRPGFMRTGLATGNAFRMPGIRSAEEAAHIIIRRLGGRRSVITFPLWLSFIADSTRLLPRPVFDRLARWALAFEGESG